MDEASWPSEESAGGLDAAEGGRALVELALAGDRRALERLWEEHRRWVAAVLLAHKPREAELEDLLQEVAQMVVGKIDQVREAGAFVPWLRSVAISIARTKGRRATVRRRGWRTLTACFAASGRGEGHEAAAGGEPPASVARGRALLDLAADLAEGYREPLLMKCVQGMSYRQIGAAMGLPETTIETRIARARRMLRERAESAGLGREDEDEPRRGGALTAVGVGDDERGGS